MEKVRGLYLIVAALTLVCMIYPLASQGQGTYIFSHSWPDEILGLRRPESVAVDSSGNVYVADTRNDRVQKFDSNGTYLTQWGTYGIGNGEFDWPEGIAVGSSGNVYVVDSGNNRVQKFDPNGTYLTQWGTWGNGNGEFDDPQGISVDSSDNVYVADGRNDRVQKFDSNGTYLTQWGTYGIGNGEFDWPEGIAVGSSGNVYVVDTWNNRVQKFDSNGTYLTQWGTAGSGNGEFDDPEGIAVDSSGNVYVVDTDNGRVQKFDSNGTYLTQWGTGKLDNGQFDGPEGIAIDNSGNVYVVDRRNNRVQKFDSNGTYLTKWGTAGTGNGEFRYPWDIAVDSSGNVYVTDIGQFFPIGGNNRVQKFDSNGTYLTQWGTAGTGNGEFDGPEGIAIGSSGNVYVVDSGNNRVQKFDSNGTYLTQWGTAGTGNGEFEWPEGIAIDSSGNVYVADGENDRVQKFDSNGTYLTQWGIYGSGNGEFKGPEGIAIDSSGNVYVTDRRNNRVQKFGSNGTYLTQWGTWGDGNGEFRRPSGLAVDSSGNVYVADAGNHRIQVFSSSDAQLLKFLTLPFADSDINLQQAWIYSWDEPHNGIDYIDGTINELPWESFDVLAAADGVAMQTSGGGYGNFVLIQHDEVDGDGNRYFTLYSHLDTVAANIIHKADRYDTAYPTWTPVPRGEYLGRAGATGVPEHPDWIHLHFEVQRGGYGQNKTDPYDLRNFRDFYPGWNGYSACGPDYLWTTDPPSVPNIDPNQPLTQIAVTDPDYDDIGAILQSMGYEYTEIQDSDLANYDYISQFDVIFINCSNDSSSNAGAAQSSLEQFVSEGGHIYTSDWAYIYVETSFPGNISFPADPYIGVEDLYVQADVVDMGLAEYLGKSNIEIFYDLGGWVAIQSVAPDVNVYLRGTVQTVNGIASANVGQVQPPTSRKPSFTVQGAQTTAAISDMPLCVSFEYGEGKVLYTTFHNEPQISEDERKLLEYLILIPYTGSLSDDLTDDMEASGYEVRKENLGTTNQGETSSPYAFNNTNIQDLAFGTNWLGSTLKLSVYAPGGALYLEEQTDNPPLIIEVQQAEVGEWTYTITGVDVPYDTYPYVVQVSSVGRIIGLVMDWNLISIPVQLADTSMAAVLQSIDGLYDAVWGYDPVDGWERHVVGGLPFLNTLTDILPSKGYWLDMSEAADLALSGVQVEDAIPLAEDWNLVGFNHSTEMDLMDALASIDGFCNAVWGYDPISGWERYVTDGLPYLNTMVEFRPGRGYWIDAKAGCPPWDMNGGVVAAPSSLPITTKKRQIGVSVSRPELPYTVWGSVEANGIKMADGAIVFLEVDGKTQASYRLGSRAGYGDLYVLDIPANVISAGARLRVRVDDEVIEAAPLPPGNPGQIIHLDLSVDMTPKFSMLHQNYPNPFNPETWIPYQLEEGANVVINIYNLTGQLVRALKLGHRSAGFYIDKARAAYWDGKNAVGEHVASGVYFYTIQAGEFAATRKTIVAK